MKYLLFILCLLSSLSFAQTDCVSSNIGVYDANGALYSSHTQAYKANTNAILLSQSQGKATIKTPDIVCTTKTSSSASSISSSISSVSSSYISSAYSSSSSRASSQSSISSSYSSSSTGSSISASWIIRADFERGLGTTAIGSDAFSGTTQAIISDEVSAVSGTKVAKLPITSTCGGCFGVWGGIIDFPAPLSKGDEVRIKLSIYWPNGFNYNANPWLKFLRVKTLNASGGNGGYDDIYIPNSGDAHAYQFIYEGEQVWTRFGVAADKVQFGRWEQYELYIKFDSVSATNGGTAIVQFWKDGRLLSTMPERKTLGGDTFTATSFYLFTYWNGNSSLDQHVYVDDITIIGTNN